MNNPTTRMMSDHEKAHGVGGSAVAEDAGPPDHLSAEVDAAFYRWLVGANGYQATPEVQAHILDLVRTLAQDPAAASGLVPRVPELIPQLLGALSGDEVSNDELARAAERDLVLVAEVIREANSAYYRPQQPVKTLDAALLMIGQNGLRMLLARIAFRPLIRMADQGFARQVAPQVWEQSEQCAQAASLVAPGLQAGVFEAYLAGLMQNVGLMVALRLAERAGTPDTPGKIPGAPEFGQRLFEVSRALSAAIAAHWEFPPQVVRGIAAAGAADAPALSRALVRGDQIAKLRMLVDARVVALDDALVSDGLDDAERRCLEKLADPAG